MKKELKRVWVDPQFHKQLKKQAAENEMPIADWTRMLAEQGPPRFGEPIYPKKKKKKSMHEVFRFEF